MKVQLTRYNRIEKGQPGDIVEVSPERARFLIGVGLAVPAVIRERIETPEKKSTAARKETRAKSTAKKTVKK